MDLTQVEDLERPQVGAPRGDQVGKGVADDTLDQYGENWFLWQWGPIVCISSQLRVFSDGKDNMKLTFIKVFTIWKLAVSIIIRALFSFCSFSEICVTSTPLVVPPYLPCFNTYKTLRNYINFLPSSETVAQREIIFMKS